MYSLAAIRLMGFSLLVAAAAAADRTFICSFSWVFFLHELFFAIVRSHHRYVVSIRASEVDVPHVCPCTYSDWRLRVYISKKGSIFPIRTTRNGSNRLDCSVPVESNQLERQAHGAPPSTYMQNKLPGRDTLPHLHVLIHTRSNSMQKRSTDSEPKP